MLFSIAVEFLVRVSGRVDDTMYVPIRVQQEFTPLAQPLRTSISTLPCGDVVRDPGHDEHGAAHVLEGYRLAEHSQRTGARQRVVEHKVEVVAVQPSSQPRGVAIPVENVEGRRLLTKQVVVNPVVPNEIV